MDLTLEQSFQLARITQDVNKMSPDQLKEMTLTLVKQSMIKDTLYQEFIRTSGAMSFLPPK